MLKKAAQLSSIDQLVMREIPTRARTDCTVGEFKDGTLCLIIENGGWSTAIRYQQNNLIKKLRAYPEFSTLTKILVKTRPSAAPLFAQKQSETQGNRSDNYRASETEADNERGSKTEFGQASYQGDSGPDQARKESKTGQFENITDPGLREALKKAFYASQINK